MNNINVYDQYSATARAESPLFHAELSKLAGRGPATAGVTLRERALLGHLVIRGDAHDEGFTGAVQSVVGLEVPGPLAITQKGESSLQWPAPDERLPGVVRPRAGGARGVGGRRRGGGYGWLWLQGASAEYGLRIEA